MISTFTRKTNNMVISPPVVFKRFKCNESSAVKPRQTPPPWLVAKILKFSDHHKFEETFNTHKWHAPGVSNQKGGGCLLAILGCIE